MDEDDVDVFEELGVGAPTADSPNNDPLEAFLEDEEDAGVEVEELGTEILEIQVDEEEGNDDDDPFVTLGVSGPSVALTTDDSEDPLAALMEDDEVAEEEVEGETPDAPPSPSTETVSMDSIAAYRMVLETVWVDGILDPGEVSLLAGRRKELGISFEEHLTLVRDMLG